MAAYMTIRGAYILTESTNKLYRVENVVISDAGNTRPDIKGVRNTICLMLQSIEILMNRIRTIQIRTNIYNRTKKKLRILRLCFFAMVRMEFNGRSVYG